MASSFLPAAANSASSAAAAASRQHASPSSSADGAVSSENNARIEDDLYVVYLQARSRGIPVSAAELLEWAHEIAADNGYYDRDEARTALGSEWLAGWYSRYNVDEADDGDHEDQERDDREGGCLADEEADEQLDGEEDAEVEEEDEIEEGSGVRSSLVLYPPPIGNPLTPSPPPTASKSAAAHQRHGAAKNLSTNNSNKSATATTTKNSNVDQLQQTNGSAVSNNNSDMESVVNNYMSTPAPRSRLFEHMLAECACNLLMAFMRDSLRMGDSVRPEFLQPEELNRILIQFFRQVHRPGTANQPYPVKVLHGILEGLSRYLRGCSYGCDLAYESNFSEARTAFGEQLMRSFEYESKQRHMANKIANGEASANGTSSDDDDEDDATMYEEITKKMQQDHRLRPLGSDECPPDEAMASFNKNTQKVMTWAAKNVAAFGRERLGLSQFSRVEEMPPELLNIVLTRFFCESRKADGTEFGWNSYKSVFSNLEAYLRVHRYPLGLHDPVFRLAKQTLFNVLRPSSGNSGGNNNNNNHNNASMISSAAGNGVGTNSSLASALAGGRNSGSTAANNASAGGIGAGDNNSTARPLYHRPIEINSNEENILWSKGAFGWHSPQAINTTLYYYMRHIYGVRSGESHRRINFGDLRTMKTEDGREEYLVYTKAAAGVDMSRLRRMWATRDDRCIVRVFKMMVAKRPPETRKADAPLYLQPKRQRQYVIDSNQAIDNAVLPTADEASTDCWFTTAPLGKNALATLMREAYQSCGLDSTRFATGLSGVGSSNNNKNGTNNSSMRRFNGGGYGDGLDDDDGMANESSNMGDEGDDARSSSSSRPGSSSSFSHPPSLASPNYNNNNNSSNNNVQNLSSRQIPSSALLVGGNSKRQQSPNNGSSLPVRRPFLTPSAIGRHTNNDSSSAIQNQAMDLASNSNRKRDNMGRFTGGVGQMMGGSSSSPGSNNNQEALSLCTNNNNKTDRSRLLNNGSGNTNGASDLVMRNKFAKLSSPSSDNNGIKLEPAGGKSRLSGLSMSQNNNNNRHHSPLERDDSAPASGSSSSTTPGALSASAFSSGVGNMSISMQPQTAADMADVLGFLNQFLNSLNNNSGATTNQANNGGAFKCSINVTVNISNK